MIIETYGTRRVFKNPFTIRKGWKAVGYSKGLVRHMRMTGLLQ